MICTCLPIAWAAILFRKQSPLIHALVIKLLVNIARSGHSPGQADQPTLVATRLLSVAIIPTITSTVAASLLSTIATITTPVSAIAAPSSSSALVLLIVVVLGVLFGLVLDLLAIVEVLTLGLDELVGFGAGEASDELFG